MKLLGAIGPNGEFTFLSSAYGGSSSDVEITRACGFLECVERADVILADKAFTVEHECNLKYARLMHPAFAFKGQKYFSAEHAAATSRIARARIHVERAFARLGMFHYLQKEVKLSQADIFGICVRVACGFTHYYPSLLKDEVGKQYFASSQ